MSGQSLYPAVEVGTGQRTQGPTPAQLLEQERQSILNEGDFQEYKVCHVNLNCVNVNLLSRFTLSIRESVSRTLSGA